MQQYHRSARLIVGLGKTARTYEGLRLRFEVVKNQITARLHNSLKVEVFNLNADSRARIEERGTQVRLEVGYGGNLRRLFEGQIRRTFSIHEETEWITTIYANEEWRAQEEATISQTWTDGVPLDLVLANLAESFGVPVNGYSIKLDKTHTFLNTLTLTGSTADALTNLGTDFGFTWGWVDGRLEITGADPDFPDQAVVITAATGMIGSPVVTDLGIEVTVLLNPALRIHRKIKIESVGAGIRVGGIEIREEVPALHAGEYRIGEIISQGDTFGNEWISKVKTFRGVDGSGG